MKLSLNVSEKGLTVCSLDHFWDIEIVGCLRISQIFF